MARRILSAKQRAFIEQYVSNGQNGTRAYLDAAPGVDYDSARSSAPRLLASDSIRSEILYLIQKRNIGPSKWADVLENSLVAVTDDNKPDYSTQLKAVDLTAKLADAYPHESTKTVDHRHAHVHVQLTEPIEVTRFRVLHGRAPTERELSNILPKSNDTNDISSK